MGAAERRWILVLYVVPARPTRLRAAVWRDVRAAGAVYLRDGVCALPEGTEAGRLLTGIAERVQRMGGEATLVRDALLDAPRTVELEERLRAARAAEYMDVGQEAAQLAAQVEAELEHRDMSWRELAELETDMNKLGRWAERVRARDTFALPEQEQMDALLARCRAAVAAAGRSVMSTMRVMGARR